MNLNFAIHDANLLQRICTDLLTFDETKEIVLKNEGGVDYPATELKPTSLRDRIVQWWHRLWSKDTANVDKCMQAFLKDNITLAVGSDINIAAACQYLVSQQKRIFSKETTANLTQQLSIASVVSQKLKEMLTEAEEKANEANAICDEAQVVIQRTSNQEQIARDALGAAQIIGTRALAIANSKAQKIVEKARQAADEMMDKANEANKLLFRNIQPSEPIEQLRLETEVPDLMIKFPNREPIFFHISVLKKYKDSFFDNFDFSVLDRDLHTEAVILDFDNGDRNSFRITAESMELCRKFMYGETTCALISKRELIQLYQLTFYFGLTELNLTCKNTLIKILSNDKKESTELLKAILNSGYSHLIPLDIRKFFINNFDFTWFEILTFEQKAEFFRMLQQEDTKHMVAVPKLKALYNLNISNSEVLKIVQCLSNNPNEQNMKEGMAHYLKAKEQGYDFSSFEENPAFAECVYTLGKCFDYGYGTQRDTSRAMALYEKAAEMNFPQALSYLGRCYFKGHGTLKDLSKAFIAFHKAADQNDPEGVYSLGLCYLSGFGTYVNREEGLRLVRAAAGLNYQLAINYLRLM